MSSRWVLLGSGLPLLALPLYLLAPPLGLEPVPSAEEAVLVQQTEGLRDLVAAAESGSLVDCDQILVVVDQGLVQGILTAILPVQGDVGGGFHVRIDSANATFGDSVALVRLEGEASVPGRTASAHVTVYGGLEVFEVLPDTGLLRSLVTVYGVEVTRADVLGVDERTLARATHAGLDALLHSIEVPVRLENRLALPAVRAKRLRIPATELPLQVGVSKVQVFGGKLWVCLGAALAGASPSAKSGTDM